MQFFATDPSAVGSMQLAPLITADRHEVVGRHETLHRSEKAQPLYRIGSRAPKCDIFDLDPSREAVGAFGTQGIVNQLADLPYDQPASQSLPIQTIAGVRKVPEI
ncbi:MAG: hypothetical protein M0008_07145 [Actinomycetota bacterium]|jgi:hypothetical protein|nr:hypothetical protein [Actinomycetota bacterium]